MSKTGRNDPCPCGSGKKYKKCCLSQDLENKAQENSAKVMNKAIEEAMAGQQFESLDDAQVFVNHKVQQMNEKPREDLGGFSPSQLQGLLYSPLEEQTLIQWQKTISSDVLKQVLIFCVYQSLKNYLQEHKAKATLKGMLPIVLVKFVHSEFEAAFGNEALNYRYNKINKEQDFRELHIGRIIFELAGLIRKYKGHFVLTKKALKLSDDETYKLLFTTYVNKYNWAYEDGYEEASFFQTATWYSLVALHRMNGQEVKQGDFAEDFMLVFPAVLDSFEATEYQTSLNAATNAYKVRMIERFWVLFGLVTLKGERFTKEYNARFVTSDILEQVFVF
jgi:hypothetical protein